VSGWLPRPAYWLARQALPIPCVDVLPIREGNGAPQVGLIRRIGPGGRNGGWALVGGRVLRLESLEEAIARHLRSTLGPAIRIGQVDAARPLYAAEYSPDGRPGGRIDPHKHAIALSYVVPIDGEPKPRGEATGFQWFGLDALPPDDAFAFSHGGVVAALIEADERLRR
jgi:ADP-ribose pyrophosphatase YjhB (NUDIX family)